MYRLALTLIASVLLTSSVFAQDSPLRHIHDPVIVKHDGKFILFSTNGRIRTHTSDNLHNWKFAGPAFPTLPQWVKREVPKATDLWAPDVSYFGGKWHMYYSVSSFGSNRSRIGHATSKGITPSDPNYLWSDQGYVVQSNVRDNFNAIDANVAFDKQGRPWLTFGSFWDGIRLIRLDPRTGRPVGNQTRIAARPGGEIEAPFIWRNGEYFYLFVSFDRCCKGLKSTYKVAVGRSLSITGPYVDFNGKRMLNGGGTILLATHGHCIGPGHCAVLRDGKRNLLVHHFYDGQHNGTPTLQLRPLLFDSKQWPIIGYPDIDAFASPRTRLEDGRYDHIVGFGRKMSLNLLRSGNINRERGTAVWQERSGRLRFTWKDAKAPGGRWIDECVVSPDGKWYAGRNQSGVDIRGLRSQ
jgi:arabinan endo-1,5-alpha-L-arabinosidase